MPRTIQAIDADKLRKYAEQEYDHCKVMLNARGCGKIETLMIRMTMAAGILEYLKNAETFEVEVAE